MRSLIYEKHELIRYGFIQLLKDMFPVEYCLEAESPEAVESLLDQYSFDWLFINGEELDRETTGGMIDAARSGNPAVKTVLLHNAGGKADLSFLEKKRISGVAGTNEPVEDLMKVLKGIEEGNIRYSFAHNSGPDSAGALSQSGVLTRRENEVFVHLIRGYSVAESARALGISLKTVENHRNSLRAKLKVTSQKELMSAAERLGYIQFKS
ncbi:response regulator transcription factor [Alteribacter natronophilus]|uniref:response regulator transcription factor n=1 Tax=Alteribacter natronophilus TaxID=2583810 RepID=UPI00110E8FB1|nr:response regulator transcription factor [Alteribacter natronophilus]TMW70275.1 response regulator transcription factor [Alteribacter natronophilus]